MCSAVALGIDLAWSDHNFSGACALDETGRVVDERFLRNDDEVLVWVQDIAAAASVVAIDAPLRVPNAKGRRRCEIELSREYASRKAGPHSSNRERFVTSYGRVRGEDLARDLEALGFRDPWTGLPRTLIEVYPHPALVEAFDLPERLRYKRKSGFRVSDQRAGLARLEEMISSLRTADPPINATRIPVTNDIKGRDLKRLEDRLDARICAWVAAVWRNWGEDRVRLFGTSEDGHIAVPQGNFVQVHRDHLL